MFTVGPRSANEPFAACSWPTTAPYWKASGSENVAASEMPAGSWVTFISPSATPSGPSSYPPAGMQSAGLAMV